MAVPSVKASTLTSGPVRNSSMTISLPESPKARSSIMVLTAASASERFLDNEHALLPRARPSALTTTGNDESARRYASALAGSSKTSYRAVGMLYFCMRFLAKLYWPQYGRPWLLGRSRGCRPRGVGPHSPGPGDRLGRPRRSPRRGPWQNPQWRRYPWPRSRGRTRRRQRCRRFPAGRRPSLRPGFPSLFDDRMLTASAANDQKIHRKHSFKFAGGK